MAFEIPAFDLTLRFDSVTMRLSMSVVVEEIAMIPSNPGMSFEQALAEIARLRDRLAEVEQDRDSLRRDLEKLLPPLPPELQYLDADPKEVMKDSIPFDEAFIQSLKADNP